MSRKASPPLRIAPLQRIVAESITDPVEQAALDHAHKREKRKRERGPGSFFPHECSANVKTLQKCVTLTPLEHWGIVFENPAGLPTLA